MTAKVVIVYIVLFDVSAMVVLVLVFLVVLFVSLDHILAILLLRCTY